MIYQHHVGSTGDTMAKKAIQVKRDGILDREEAIQYIVETSHISPAVIRKVLDGEREYMEKKGTPDPDESVPIKMKSGQMCDIIPADNCGICIDTKHSTLIIHTFEDNRLVVERSEKPKVIYDSAFSPTP